MNADPTRPAELDYAFLASWAGLQPDGTMTAVGMSFLRVQRQDMPMSLAVAGRIRVYGASEGARLTIRMTRPGANALEVSDWLRVSNDESASYDDGRRQILFVLNTQTQISEAGMYTVDISLDDKLARTLKFEVIPSPAAQ
jgi:hypothetical protein